MAEAATNQTTRKKFTTEKGSPLSRKTIRKQARDKRAERLQTDKEFAKSYFEAKSKRSGEKKTSFRKRRSGKK